MLWTFLFHFKGPLGFRKKIFRATWVKIIGYVRRIGEAEYSVHMIFSAFLALVRKRNYLKSAFITGTIAPLGTSQLSY